MSILHEVNMKSGANPTSSVDGYLFTMKLPGLPSLKKHSALAAACPCLETVFFRWRQTSVAGTRQRPTHRRVHSFSAYAKYRRPRKSQSANASVELRCHLQVGSALFHRVCV